MTQPFVVEQPGIYLGVPDNAYHADPVPGGSLSSTGARAMLPPSCPALFRHRRDNPTPPKRAFDFGHAAHHKVLGTGPDLVVVPGERWDTKAAKEAVAEVRAAGGVPLKQADMDKVDAMAAALLAHPFAAKLLQPGSGHPEASMFWIDPETRVWCRTRVDWLPDSAANTDRLIVADYKTTVSAALDDLQRSIWSYGYHQQADWIETGIRALGVHGNPTVVFICQEKEPPFLVTVAQPDPFALKVGAHLNREARHRYRECVTSGRWPSYTDDVALISLPGWVENRYAQELM
ncbi:PD-(D/E)XK nuclease-like domain-containing protein [Micromonospora sp. WMMD1082]|uniref:PD-(D/E)XK nuclease-like domain-containing protein n=1 Tax=Micromonospora sp. WMMD1082 TaxID=3016104 RepID=UPI002417DA6D|nr:PD-(D/E)XK nuclease-like domain-containing protein [Micromonospora sp. WMMD1082]MDG4796182.1 PD-(D/E)XK nuclease-like domain-containing protein [Micromonospora sp. WMMD1082]